MNAGRIDTIASTRSRRGIQAGCHPGDAIGSRLKAGVSSTARVVSTRARGLALTAATACALLAPGLALADCPKPGQHYAAYEADINGDQVVDYALVPLHDIVPVAIDDDLTIPVPVPSRAAGFTLLSKAGGVRALQPLAGNELPAGAWEASSLSVVVADVSGSGRRSLVVRGLESATTPASTDTMVVRLTSGGTASGTPVFTTPSNGYGLADGELQAVDINRDGRQDLVHRVGGLVQGVYLADASGVVALDDDATVMAVWEDFVAAALAGEPRAPLYLGSEARERYATMLSADTLRLVCQGIRAAGIVTSDDQYASVVVQRAGPSGDVLYPLTFGKTGYGSWQIIAL